MRKSAEHSAEESRYSSRMSAAVVPEAPLLIGGERAEGASGGRRLVHDPATGEAIASVAQATSEKVEHEARLADEAFRGDWRKRSPRDRAAVLFRLASGIRGRPDEPSRLESPNPRTTRRIGWRHD